MSNKLIKVSFSPLTILSNINKNNPKLIVLEAVLKGQP